MSSLHSFLRRTFDVWIVLGYQCYCIIEPPYCHGKQTCSHKKSILCDLISRTRIILLADVELVRYDWAACRHRVEVCANKVMDVIFWGFSNTSAAIQVCCYDNCFSIDFFIGSLVRFFSRLRSIFPNMKHVKRCFSSSKTRREIQRESTIVSIDW